MTIFTFPKKRNQVSLFTVSLVFAMLFANNGKTYAAYIACSNYDTVYIEHDTTWSDSVPAKFGGGMIIIRGGKTLTINGLYLQFHTYQGIISDPYDTINPAHLVVITSTLGPCIEFLGGINVWAGISINGVADAFGNYSEYENSGGISPNPNQASVQLYNATINNATVGVSVLHHAILQVNSACAFNDCKTGVQVNTFGPDPLMSAIINSPTPIPAASYIESSTFEISSGYLFTWSKPYAFICVSLTGTDYFDISGNVFKCSKTTADSAYGRPIGIDATDANFACHSTTGALDPGTNCIYYNAGTKVQNTFQNLSYAIRFNSDNYTNTIYVDDCITTDCFVAAQVRGGNHHSFHNNTFTLQTSVGWPFDTSAHSTYNNFVSFTNSPNFLFYGNVLKQDKRMTKFLLVDNCTTDKKQITLDSFINTSSAAPDPSDAEYAIFFTGDNRNQIVTCNGFVHHLFGIYADAGAQLTPFGSASDHVSVGNIFTDMSTPTSQWLFNNNTAGTFPFLYTSKTSIDPIHYNSSVGETDNISDLDECFYIDQCRTWGPLGINTTNHIPYPIKVYPNPADNQLIFDFSEISLSRMGAKIDITNAIGQEIINQKTNDYYPQVVFNTSSYANGVYLYRILINGSMEKTGKFEIKH